MHAYINLCIIINITTIIIILLNYFCISFIHGILHIPNSSLPKIFTALQYNLKGPTIGKCMHIYYLHHYITTTKTSFPKQKQSDFTTKPVSVPKTI